MGADKSRPPHLPPGTPVGDHYTVEGLVRLAECRMFYLVNDARPDRPTRKCWECGHTNTPRTEPVCRACQAPMRDRRFLMSSRWKPQHYPAYEAFFRLGLSHPGLCTPLDVFRYEGQLLSLVPYHGEGLMVDEAAPLSNERVLDLGQRIAGTLAFLHLQGVRVSPMRQANLLLSPDNTVRLFDLDITEVGNGPVAPEHRAHELTSIGWLLRRYCDVQAPELADFMAGAEEGGYASPAGFGRAVESKWSTASAHFPPVLGNMSDVGLVRQLNEDNWGWKRLSDRASLYVVADGMGGHDAGEVASDLAVRIICRVAAEGEAKQPPPLDAIEPFLEHAFQSANNGIKDEADARGTDMGTTMVCALVVDDGNGGKLGFMGNVGDSRGYLWRDQALHQVSRDHSLVQKMVERGRITAEEARTHPHSNILLRTVGTERDVEIDIFRVELKSGDRLLMCSDGLWGEVEDRDIETILNTYSDPRISARELVRAAHHGGGKDNVTLMIVAVP